MNFLIIIAAIVLMGFSQYSFSSNNEEQAPVYVIGVEPIPYYPLYDFDETGRKKASFTRDLLSAFFEKHQYNYRFQALPIKRVDSLLLGQEIDFKFPDNPLWRKLSQGTQVHFSKAVLKLVAGTYVLEKNVHLPRENIDSIATIFGFIPVLWLPAIEKNKVDVQYEATPISIVKHLLHENVMATNIDQNVLRHYMRVYQKQSKDEVMASSKIVLNKNIDYKKYGYHLSSVRYPDVLKKFDLFLQSEAKFILQLKKKYQILEEF